jgi:hypothetical protein
MGSSWGDFVTVPDLVLFPHCDLHVALDRATPSVAVFTRTMQGEAPQSFSSPYQLTDVTSDPGVRFDFYAPYAPVGQRFANLPRVQPDGRILADTPGIYLFQCSFDGRAIVGRLQVHQAITDWWFGNDSITTALDGIAHAQPTIYAEFSDDNVPGFIGTDLVGDITGHGYVTLTSANPAIVEVSPQGRLRGIAETGAQPVNLTGTMGIVTRQLPVRVVEYGRRREILQPVVGHSPTKDPANTPNLLFLGEGFTGSTADQLAFDRIVEGIYMGMFIKPRHEPFPMLLSSMNVYKAPTASTQDLLTCGFRVVDRPLLKGEPIPFEGLLAGVPANAYTVGQLVARVGLPRRGEARTVAQLIAEWNTQHLHDFNAALVHPGIVEAWRDQQSVGILQARDTFFGLHFGQRLADRISDNNPVPNPGPNGPNAQLEAFVRKLYSFYGIRTSQTMHLDPRRHPPELYSEGMDNPLTSLMRYVRALAEELEPHRNVGFEWAPDLTRLKRSRGMIIMVAKDFKQGGENIENGLACLTLDAQIKIGFAYGSPPLPRVMRRTPVATIAYDENRITDLAVHELGHSFNLGDEYENIAGDTPDTVDETHDNVTNLAAIRIGPNTRRFNPDRVKWLRLPRIQLASRVRSEVELVPGGVRVVVPPEDIPLWVAAQADNPEVFLRRAISFTGRQLPVANGDQLSNLHIHAIDRVLATIDLNGPQPPADLPFTEGAILFVPARDSSGAILRVTQQRVLEHFQHAAGGLPLNPGAPGPDNRADVPEPIARFTPTNPASYTIGVYEGGAHYATGTYRPAGACKMRNQYLAGDEGAFCFVCQWLIVNRINPAMHRRLDLTYSLGTTHV